MLIPRSSEHLKEREFSQVSCQEVVMKSPREPGLRCPAVSRIPCLEEQGRQICLRFEGSTKPMDIGGEQTRKFEEEVIERRWC